MEKEKGRRELFITVALSILSYYCGEQKLVGWILKKLAYNISRNQQDDKLLNALKETNADVQIITNVPSRMERYYNSDAGNHMRMTARRNINVYISKLNPENFQNGFVPFFNVHNHAKIIGTEGGYRDKRGNSYFGRSRILLLGILYAGPQYDARGEIVVKTIPTSKQVVESNTSIMTNLGYYIKAEELCEFQNFIEKGVLTKV